MTAHKKRSIQLLIVAGLIVAAVWGIESVSTQALTARHAIPPQTLALMLSPSVVNDGNRLAHVDGCFSCHGGQLTGHVVFTGWFGTRITAPNLTRLTHRETEAQLAAAIRYGVKHDGTSVIGKRGLHTLGV